MLSCYRCNLPHVYSTRITYDRNLRSSFTIVVCLLYNPQDCVSFCCVFLAFFCDFAILRFFSLIQKGFFRFSYNQSSNLSRNEVFADLKGAATFSRMTLGRNTQRRLQKEHIEHSDTEKNH